MKDETIISIIAIICLTLLETAAILTHTDGAFFMPIVAAISGIAGYHIKGYLAKKK